MIPVIPCNHWPFSICDSTFNFDQNFHLVAKTPTKTSVLTKPD